MKKLILAAGASVATLAFATPANAAVVLCSSGPGIDLTVNQCTAAGNDHLADVEAAIAAATGVSVASLELSLFGKSDDNPSYFTFGADNDPDNGQTTDWNVLSGQLIKYVTVKGGTGFKVYELPGTGASAGLAFSTAGLVNGGGNQPDISHLSFWKVPGGAVPEPATWALMILGFAAIGGALRQRKSSDRIRVAYS